MEELKRLREEKGWSQTRLAQESGVDRATINQVEGGRRSPTIATLELLASALGAEVADFFPKAQSPLPLDAPADGTGPRNEAFADALEDFRRTTYRHVGYHEIQQALDEYRELWEKRLAEGDFDKAALEEAGRTIKFFWPAVTAAADSELVDSMRFGTYEEAEEAAADSKLVPAIRRFQALCESVNSTYREMFLSASTPNVLPFPVREAS